ncbi:MAG TPA: phosphatase PAP2 family protein, partial [Terrimicrobiaceae bacterium]|nr:phosphatase PAP2 family protein [Terrimicrobiaceae bacterium]
MISLVRHRLILGAIVCAALLVGGYLAMVRTTWGHMLDNAGFFGRSAVARTVVEYDRRILGAVSLPSLALAIVAILLVGMIRRCLPGAIIVATGFACAVVGADLLKEALPWHALVPQDSYLADNLHRNTYPSGHTSIGTSVALAFLLVSAARWRPWLAVLAGFVSASFATGVLFDGWHRPS